MNLSVRIVKRPREKRPCCICGRYIEGEAIRVYGMADYGDKPQNYYLHRTCSRDKDTLKKIAEIEAAK